MATQVGNADERKADGTGDSLAIGDVDLESPHGGAMELPFAGSVDDEGGSILMCSIMLPVMSGSSLAWRMWLDAPVSTIMLKRTGSGLV